MSDIDSSKPLTLNLLYHVRNVYKRYLLTLEVVGCKQLDVNTWYVLSTTHNWEHGTFKITLMKKTNASNFPLKPRGFFKYMREFYKGRSKMAVADPQIPVDWTEMAGSCSEENLFLDLDMSATFVLIEYRELSNSHWSQIILTLALKFQNHRLWAKNWLLEFLFEHN